MPEETSARGLCVNDLGGLDINQSRLSNFMSCEVLYEQTWEYGGTGLSPKQMRLALSFGSSYHDGVAEYYRNGRDVGAAISVALKKLVEERERARLMAGEISVWDEAVNTLAIMLNNYHVKFHDETINVLAPEVKGVARLGSSPHRLVFRTDALFEQYNRISILESKTKNRTPGGGEITKIHLDLQPTAYVYGVRRETGLDVTDVRYRWAIKKPEYDVSRMFVEEVTSRTARDLDRFEQQAIWICDRILDNRKTGKWIMNFGQCTIYGECDMIRLCRHHRDSSVVALYNQRKPDYVHESAAGPKPATDVGVPRRTD
jgi:hypothetical protein